MTAVSVVYCNAEVNSDDLIHLSPKSESALELISKAAPSVEAHHRSVGPDAGRNSGGSRIIIIKKVSHYVWT